MLPQQAIQTHDKSRVSVVTAETILTLGFVIATAILIRDVLLGEWTDDPALMSLVGTSIFGLIVGGALTDGLGRGATATKVPRIAGSWLKAIALWVGLTAFAGSGRGILKVPVLIGFVIPAFIEEAIFRGVLVRRLQILAGPKVLVHA